VRILRLPEVKDKFGFRSDASVFACVKSGVLPQSIAISARSKGWPDFEIEQILCAKIAGKSDDDIKQIVQSQLAYRQTLVN